MLTVTDLSVEIEEEPILRGFSLTVKPGEICALMGPNGAGKSTLAKVLAGHPSYRISGGQVRFEGEDLLALAPEERAQRGLFVGFQYPVEVPGVTNFEFLYGAHSACIQSKGEKPLERALFRKKVFEKMEAIGIAKSFLDRPVNSGFSGGEKKRNEVLQMAVLEPKLAILDETDSGLDVDAMRTVASGIKQQIGKEQGLILITHYYRLLEYIRPDVIHIVMEGKIVQSGGIELALSLEEKGYDKTITG